MDGQVKVLVAAFIDDAMRVLLSRHGENGKWHLPDTELRFGETTAAALIRGFREDFGRTLDVLATQPCATAQVFDADKGTHYVILCYPAQVVDGVPATRLSSDAPHCFVFSYGDIKDNVTLDSTVRMLRQAYRLDRPPL